MITLIKYFIFTGFIFISSTVNALSIGMVNDFQTGTVEGWMHPVSNPNTPAVALNGGVSGIGDSSLWVSADGQGGPGSRLLAVNRSVPWMDVVSPDVTAIEMDLKHVNAPELEPDLKIRIAFSDTFGGGGTWYASETAYNLNEANSGNWEHAVFDFSDLELVSGSAPLAAVLDDIAEVRILHSNRNGFKGDSINAVFAVDNISAVPVPAAFFLFSSALLGLLGRKRQNRHK